MFSQALTKFQLPKGIEDSLLTRSAKSETHAQFQAVGIFIIYSASNAATHDAANQEQGTLNEQTVVGFLKQKLSQTWGTMRSCTWIPMSV